MLRPAYRYAAKLSNRGVVDGDTYDLDVDCGFTVWVRIRVRLLDWSCPELREPRGLEAKAAAAEILTAAPQIILETHKDVQTFGRWVGAIWIDGRELGELLAERGLAIRS